MKLQSVSLPPIANPFVLCGDRNYPIDANEVLQQIPDLICVVGENGIIEFVSAASRHLLGFSVEELSGRPFVDLLVPEEQPWMLRNLLNQSQRLSVYYIELKCQTKSGRAVYVHWSVKWQPVERKLYCVAKDASQQRYREQRLLNAQEIAGVCNFEFDVLQQKFVFLSDSFYRVFGIDKRKNPVVDADLFWSLVHPCDRERLRLEFSTASPTGHKTVHHYRVEHPGGRLVYLSHIRELWFDEQGRHYKTQGTIQDISSLKSAEEALYKSEKKFRALAAGGSDLVGIISPEGLYTYVGDSVDHLLGFHPSELEGQPVTNFIHPDDVRLVKQLIEKAMHQSFLITPHLRICNRQREWRWLEVRVTNMLQDPAIRGLVVNGRDITAQKRTDDRLRELSLIAQESMQAIIITDKTHRITWVNKAFCTISGLTEAAVVEKRLLDVIGADLQQTSGFRIMQQQLEQGQVVEQEIRCLHTNGTPYWVQFHIQPVYNADGNLVQYLAIGVDITKRKQAEQELLLSEQRFKALVQQGSDLIVILDEEGRFTYCSDSIQHALGYEPGEVLHQFMLQFIHPDDVAETLAGINRVRQNAPIGGVRHRFRRKDGGYTWLESKGTNHYANPLIQGMIVNARDITDQVLLQERLDLEVRHKQKAITSAVIKAQESERSKLGLELHDNVNQVLTTVKLYNEMYLTGFREDRSLLERSAQYLQDCINEIRSISKRLSAPTLGRISLHDSVADLLDSVNMANKLQVSFTSSGLEQLHIAEDLHLSIYRILQEGLSNIIKYADASLVAITLTHTGSEIMLVIRDDGKGFDTSVKRKGIGITNMRTRAEHMNGVFQLTSAEGAGSTITARFKL